MNDKSRVAGAPKLQRAGAVQDAARFLIIIVPHEASCSAAALCRFLRRTQAEGAKSSGKGRNMPPRQGWGIFGSGFYKDVALRLWENMIAETLRNGGESPLVTARSRC